MSFQPQGIAVGTLRARGAVRNEPAQKLWLRQVLERAEFMPRALPPAAVLIVRNLRQPLQAPADGRHGHDSAQRFGDATREQLDRLYLLAARPARGEPAFGAAAVVFDSPAELLACFLVDLASSRTADRWWWHWLMKRIGTGWRAEHALVQLLGDELHLLPAVVVQLTQRRALQTLEKLAESELFGLLDRLCTRHRLQVVAGILSHRKPHAFPADQRYWQMIANSAAAAEGSAPDVGAGGTPSTQVEMAMRQLQTEVPASWQRPLLRLFVALSLQLFHAPWMLRSDSGQRCLVDRVVDRQSVPAGATDAQAPLPEPVAQAPGIPEEIPTTHRPDRHPSGLAQTPLNAPHARLHGRRVVEVVAATRSGRSAASNPRAPLSVSPGPEVGPAAKAEGSVAQPPAAACEQGVSTRLGGCFYLLNLFTALDLPDRFEEAWSLASRLGPWALLEAVTRAWTSPVAPEVADDPIWSLLRELDGRGPAEIVGSGLQVGCDFQLPAVWMSGELDLVPPFYWSCAQGRLRLWEAQGVLLADQPVATRPVRQARALCRSVHGHQQVSLVRAAARKAPGTPPDLGGCSPALRRVLGWLLPVLRTRMAQAMGEESLSVERLSRLLTCPAKVYAGATHLDVVMALDDIRMELRQAALDRDPGWLLPVLRTRMAQAMGEESLSVERLSQLLTCPAKVYAGATHLDVVMALDDIRLELRQAGLDRDPGWLPGWARVVSFHFE